MDASGTEFLRRLERGPAVLFLGQLHLAGSRGHDPLLSHVQSKYETPHLTSYADLVGLKTDATALEVLAWMDERCRRIPPPETLLTTSEYAWSSVVTSAIDTVLPIAFRRPWRELQPVLDEFHDPSDPRNRSRLHLIHLFGNVNRTDAAQRVPLIRMEWLRRLQVATALARRIPSLVTPMGVLAIEAYDGTDWFGSEYFAPILADLNPGQVHAFGVGDSLEQDPLFGELVESGIVTMYRPSLASILSQGQASGLVRMGPPDPGGDAHVIDLGSSVLRVPADVWNRVRTSAAILDEAAVAPPPSLSQDARYREFRAFLGSGDGVPNWAGHARGFAFQRDFERALQAQTKDALAAPGFQDQPIVLHGPTGSGKSVALATLARAIRLEREYPVLYVERASQAPSFGDFDLFCEWAEREGAQATLIVWDGTLGPAQYHQALRYLSSRGRNVVIVGTTYRLMDDETHGRRSILAPAQLSAEERRGFLAFLRGFDEGLDDLVQRQRAVEDESFLVALYRLLPPVRGVVRAGVSREVTHAESRMATSVEQVDMPYTGTNALARALHEAGLIDAVRPSEDSARMVGTELVTDFQHLTGLVMVPGRFGLRVPLELLLRAMGHGGFANFIELFNGVDVFRWYEDARGNIEIGPRTRLEARLIAEARTGGAETEVALVRELLLDIRHDHSSLSGGREVDFAVSLLQAIGPNGRDVGRFADHYPGIADTLREARLERGLANPRLMLQEANLRRETAIDEARRTDPDLESVDAGLDAAETVVREALELLSDNPRSHGLRSALLVELASTMGARSTQLLKRDTKGHVEAAGLVIGLRDVVGSAQSEDPTSYYPVDVLAWATRNAIEQDLLSGADKVEALGDVLAAFQRLEVHDLEPKQVQMFHARRYEMATLVGDDELAEESAAELKARGSGAALLLRAVREAGLAASAAEQPVDLQRVSAAVALLESDEDLLWADARCLNLYLDLWWLHMTGFSLFQGERRTPGLSADDWQHFLQIVVALQDSESSRTAAILGFLMGLALFHLDRLDESLTAFRAVERESAAVRSRRRVIRTFLASTPTGEAQQYHGSIAWLDPQARRGDVYVEELRSRITVLPRDFRLEEPRQGLDMGTFHIAFNFLGPVADPAVYTAPRT